MTATLHLVAVAAVANVVAGALLVWLSYAGLERSGAHAVVVTALGGASIIGGNWLVGEAVAWTGWEQFETTALAAVVGAFIGVGTALLVWEPADETELPPIDGEREQLEEMVENRDLTEITEEN